MSGKRKRRTDEEARNSLNIPRSTVQKDVSFQESCTQQAERPATTVHEITVVRGIPQQAPLLPEMHLRVGQLADCFNHRNTSNELALRFSYHAEYRVEVIIDGSA